MKPLTILYVGFHHDYGKPERGRSFEYHNLYESLRQMDGGVHRVVEFPMDLKAAALGRAGMNAALVDTARAEKPHLLFAVLFEDELDPAAIREVSRSGCPTMAWFCDDHWRFSTYTRFQAPYWDWCVTTAHAAVPKYRGIGYGNVILSQFGCNHFLYRPAPGGTAEAFTFVGQAHGSRPQLVARLAAAGLPVAARGVGWPAGPVSQEEMIRIFSTSRINLNPTAMGGPLNWKDVVRVFVERRPDRRLRLRTPAAAWRKAQQTWGRRREQIKGRNFEIPGCGGFQLSGWAPHLDEYYADGREIAIYRSVRELVDRARYYLAHEEERARVAEAGYRRTLAEHTYEQRFRAIFRAAGLA